VSARAAAFREAASNGGRAANLLKICGRDIDAVSLSIVMDYYVKSQAVFEKKY